MTQQVLLVIDVVHAVTGRRLIVMQDTVPGGWWGVLRIPFRFPLPDDAHLERAIARWLPYVFPRLRVVSTHSLRVAHSVGSVRVVRAQVRGSFDESRRDSRARVKGVMDPEDPEKEMLDRFTRSFLPLLNGKE